MPWQEVPAHGICRLQLKDGSRSLVDDIICYPYKYALSDNVSTNGTEVEHDLHSCSYFQRFEDRHQFIYSDIELKYSDKGIAIPFQPVCEETHVQDTSACSSQQLNCDTKIDSTNPCVITTQNSSCLTQAADSDLLLRHMTPYHDVMSEQLITILGQSVQVRVEKQSHLCHNCIAVNLAKLKVTKCGHNKDSSVLNEDKDCYSGAVLNDAIVECSNTKRCGHARVGVLYSGGIDSLVIAALADRFVPEDEPIDLLNVAFEQKKVRTLQKNKRKEDNTESATESSYNVPDRITALEGLKQLNKKRHWNFVEINVSVEELKLAREETVRSLVYPLHTVLDDSIGCAVWFAARGQGLLHTADGHVSYRSSARVVLVGMGADEQLAGYSRHRAKFQSGGWSGLVAEIRMELERISARNLGRDDRIISDHSREARFPFLDERVVSFLNSLPIHIKSNLTLPRGVGEKYLLRLAAYKLGLTDSCTLPKRAIQFGSRIAKIENRKEKGSDVCERL